MTIGIGSHNSSRRGHPRHSRTEDVRAVLGRPLAIGRSPAAFAMHGRTFGMEADEVHPQAEAMSDRR